MRGRIGDDAAVLVLGPKAARVHGPATRADRPLAADLGQVRESVHGDAESRTKLGGLEDRALLLIRQGPPERAGELMVFGVQGTCASNMVARALCSSVPTLLQ